MIKRYNIQFSQKMPEILEISKWNEQYNVQLIQKHLSENSVLIECEDYHLPKFLENLNLAKLK